MKDLPLTVAVFAALAAACWYASRLRRAVPVDLRAEARALREKLDRLSARNGDLSRLLQRSVERLQTLAQVDRELTDRALDLESLLSTLARRLAHLVGDAAAIYLPEPGRPAWRALEGATASLRERAVELFEAAGLEPMPGLVRDAMVLGRPASREACGLPCAVAVPLRSRAGQVIGAAVLVRRAGAPSYAQEAVALGEQVCERAVSALEVARAYKAREAFAAIAARELRAQSRRMLRAADEPEVAREALELFDEQTARLARLVNGDLDVDVDGEPVADWSSAGRQAQCLHEAPGPDPRHH